MINNENTWDKLLQIKTTGRDDLDADQYRYPYEPTLYSVLERLANSEKTQKTNHLVVSIVYVNERRRKND